MTLDGFLITSKDFLKYRELLEELTVNNSVNLLWVPRHSRGTPGVLGGWPRQDTQVEAEVSSGLAYGPLKGSLSSPYDGSQSLAGL